MVDIDMCSLAHKTLEETVAGKTKKKKHDAEELKTPDIER